MASRYPIRAALAAAAVPFIAVAAFGNQWFSEHVRLEADGRLARRFLNQVGGPFPWRLTPYRGDRGTALWLAHLFGVVAVVGLAFLVAWLIARRATSSGLFFGVWGATVLAAITAHGLGLLASYDPLYDGLEVEPGLNGFWYSVFHSTDAGLWGAVVGVAAGGAALLASGGAARPPRPVSWPTAAGRPGAAPPSAWPQQPVASPEPVPGVAPTVPAGRPTPVIVTPPTPGNGDAAGWNPPRPS